MRWLALRTTQREMEASPNWVQFALDRPVIHTPGSAFVYCGPDMHLLSAILQKATGTSVLEFARKNFFSPMGFHEVLWPADPQGVNFGAGNLRLLPEDMAKLGFLYLHKGLWAVRRSSPQDGWSRPSNPREKQMEILTVTGGG